MLLLVLILILIAFGLLVVALLTGSVVWAWVSVAVSAVAALVLVVDHLQRRAAVRAGRAGTESDGTGSDGTGSDGVVVGAPGSDRVENEPATEILPVAQPPAEDPDGSDRYPDQRSDQHRHGDHDAERPDGFDRGPTDQRTTSLQSFGPPGSDDRPSGAAAASDVPPGASSPSVTKSGAGQPDRGVGQPTVAGPPPDRGGDPGGQRQGRVLPSDPTVNDVPPPDLAAGEADVEDVEPPEESRDPSVAALVAQLPDEVLVVDEQPRYHLGGCRALRARAVIPLPVQEAVQLGFTPCGWCAPDQTLADRHPARAQ